MNPVSTAHQKMSRSPMRSSGTHGALPHGEHLSAGLVEGSLRQLAAGLTAADHEDVAGPAVRRDAVVVRGPSEEVIGA